MWHSAVAATNCSVALRALRAGARYLGVGGRGARLELDATLAPRLLLEHLADGGGVEVP